MIVTNRWIWHWKSLEYGRFQQTNQFCGNLISAEIDRIRRTGWLWICFNEKFRVGKTGSTQKKLKKSSEWNPFHWSPSVQLTWNRQPFTVARHLYKSIISFTNFVFQTQWYQSIHCTIDITTRLHVRTDKCQRGKYLVCTKEARIRAQLHQLHEKSFYFMMLSLNFG